MDEIPRKELVTQIALDVLERRRQEIAPQVDANIEEVLRICEERLKEAGESPAKPTALITEDDLRRRIFEMSPELRADARQMADLLRESINFEREKAGLKGFDPIEVDLYETGQTRGWAFTGKMQVGHVAFRTTGTWSWDSQGRKVLRVRLIKAP